MHNQVFMLKCSDLVTQTVRNIRTVFQLNRQRETVKAFQHIIKQNYR